ncbi:MAG: acyltransferase [Myxococcota bacterium]
MLGKIQRALSNPRSAWDFVFSRFRGELCRAGYGLTNRRVKIGSGFRLVGKMEIRGPGRVEIGDNVSVNGSGQAVTPFTHAPGALISIGSDSFVNGARFGCAEEIRVGARAILADCRLMDTDFHSIYSDRWEETAPVKSAPIILEENVWVAASAAVLKGVHIGENSVVGFGSVLTSSVPANSLVAGNPGKVVGPVTRSALVGHAPQEDDG